MIKETPDERHHHRADTGQRADGGYIGTGLIMPHRRRAGEELPDWKEESNHSHRQVRARVEHTFARMKNWRTLTRHLGRHEHISDTVQAVATLLSHQQTADLDSARQT
jgi:hypothetical protein